MSLGGPLVNTSAPTSTDARGNSAGTGARAYSSVRADDSRTAHVTSMSSEAPVAGRPDPSTTNRTAIWAMVLSILGITSPIGLFLGYQARRTIKRTRELGDSFARVAIWVGWAYMAVLVLVILAYLLITVQSS